MPERPFITTKRNFWGFNRKIEPPEDIVEHDGRFWGLLDDTPIEYKSYLGGLLNRTRATYISEKYLPLTFYGRK